MLATLGAVLKALHKNPGRVTVESAKNEGHRKTMEKTMKILGKGAQTLFCRLDEGTQLQKRDGEVVPQQPRHERTLASCQGKRYLPLGEGSL